MHFLVLQHLDIEPPALIAEVILDAGHSLHVVHLDAGESLPQDMSAYAGIIIMGGPQSANDMHLPYIRNELHWLAAQLRAGMPMLGVCLGSQLMAKAAGGSISASPRRELGWYPVYPTAHAVSDPLFSGLSQVGLPVFQWHGETFSLPEGAQLIASHPDVQAQAFRMGKAQYGMQFHAEVDEALIGQWIEAGAGERAHLGAEGIAALHAATPLHLESMHAFCRSMVCNWLSLMHD